MGQRQLLNVVSRPACQQSIAQNPVPMGPCRAKHHVHVERRSKLSQRINPSPRAQHFLQGQDIGSHLADDACSLCRR
jgi:hypothetical protein